MHIGIVGHGFVGKATDYAFDTKNITKYIVDPMYKTTVTGMVKNHDPAFIFISVPTPMSLDGSIDASIITDVFRELGASGSKAIAIVKSTVTPDVISHLEKIYSKIVYNPEFLTERNAKFDFVNAEMLVIGASNSQYILDVEKLYRLHSKCKECPVVRVDLQSASMIKYTLNCFMATKVLFFNQLKDVFDKCGTGVHWDNFTDALKIDSRLGSSHMSVPGPDGRKGFGGACFTKDTAALIKYAADVGRPFTALEEVVHANQEIRSAYEELDEREKAQNVSYSLERRVF